MLVIGVLLLKKSHFVVAITLVFAIFLMYLVVLNNSYMAANLFGLSYNQIGYLRGRMIYFRPIIFVIIFCLLFIVLLIFRNSIYSKKKVLLIAVSLLLIFIFLGFISGELPVEKNYFYSKKNISNAFENHQNSDSFNSKYIAQLELRFRNVPLQSNDTLTVTLKNGISESWTEYSYIHKFPIKKWVKNRKDSISSFDYSLKMDQIDFEVISNILKNSDERIQKKRKSLRGIYRIKLDTRNGYWRVEVQNVQGIVDRTFIYSLDGKYIITSI